MALGYCLNKGFLDLPFPSLQKLTLAVAICKNKINKKTIKTYMEWHFSKYMRTQKLVS